MIAPYLIQRMAPNCQNNAPQTTVAGMAPISIQKSNPGQPGPAGPQGIQGLAGTGGTTRFD